MAPRGVGTPTAGRKPLTSRDNDSPLTSRTNSSKSVKKAGPGPQTESRNPKTARSAKTPACDIVKPARSPVRKPQTKLSGTTNGAGHNGFGEQSPVDDGEATPETAASLESLQQRVLAAESAAAEYQKQIISLQQQLDDALVVSVDNNSSPKPSSLVVNSEQNMEALQAKHEVELAQAHAQGQVSNEDELTQELSILASRSKRNDSLTDLDPKSDTMSMLFCHSARRHGLTTTDTPQDTSNVPPSPDIEALLTELAEAHVRIIELENKDTLHIQELENSIIELKMANARLMEENEGGLPMPSDRPMAMPYMDPLSKQRVVSASQVITSTSTLATDLGLAASNGSNDQIMLEVAVLRDQNKALSLYLNNIISKILAHSELDGILDKDPDLLKGSEILANMTAEPRAIPGGPMNDGAVGFSGFLQRTKSMMSNGPKATARPSFGLRSDSLASSVASPNENQATAPRIPLPARNGQRPISIAPRRGMSDSGPVPVATANLRGRSPSKAVLSPDSISPASATLPSRPQSISRALSGSTFQSIGEGDETIIAPSKRDSKIASSRNSVISEGGASDVSSPPHSTTSNGSGEKRSGAIIMGGKPRPLRLVREAAEQDEVQRKAANRASWMGWFNKGPGAVGP